MRKYSEDITFFCYLLGKQLQEEVQEQDLVLLFQKLLGSSSTYIQYKHNPFDPKRTLMDIHFGDVYIFSMHERDINKTFEGYVYDIAARRQDPVFSGYIRINPFLFSSRLYAYHLSTLNKPL